MSDDHVQEPDLPDVFRLMEFSLLDRVRSTEIGRVTRFDESTSSVSVQPLISRARLSPTGAREAPVPQELHEVPVWFFGSGTTRITVAPQVGDYGLILFCSVSTARWKRRGGSVDPGDDRRHWRDDAFFLPGGGPLVQVPTSVPVDLVIHAGSRVVRVGGPTGTQKTLMADSFLSALDASIGAIGTAVGGITTSGAAAGVAIADALTTFQETALRAGYKTSKTEVK